jgi:hypothetical protein
LSGASNHKPIVLLSLCSDVSFFGVATPVQITFDESLPRFIVRSILKTPVPGVNIVILAKLVLHRSILTDLNMTDRSLDTQTHISLICDEVKDLLISKNKKYGDSALNPSRIFSKSSPVEQILVRIDDKLSRIKSGAGLLANDEDVIMDLMGYLVLLKIALARD